MEDQNLGRGDAVAFHDDVGVVEDHVDAVFVRRQVREGAGISIARGEPQAGARHALVADVDKEMAGLMRVNGDSVDVRITNCEYGDPGGAIVSGAIYRGVLVHSREVSSVVEKRIVAHEHIRPVHGLRWPLRYRNLDPAAPVIRRSANDRTIKLGWAYIARKELACL